MTPFSTLNPFNSPLGPVAALSYRCEAQKKNIEPCDGRFFPKKCWKMYVKQGVGLEETHIMKNSSLINVSIITKLGTLPIFGMQITIFLIKNYMSVLEFFL